MGNCQGITECPSPGSQPELRVVNNCAAMHSELRHFYFIRGVSLQPLAKQIGQDQKAFFVPYHQISLPLFSSLKKREKRGRGGFKHIMFCDLSLFSGLHGLK